MVEYAMQYGGQVSRGMGQLSRGEWHSSMGWGGVQIDAREGRW